MNFNKPRQVVLLVVLLLCSYIVTGAGKNSEEGDPSILTLERIFSTEEFSVRSLPPSQWWQGGEGYTIVEKSEEIEKGEDLVLYLAESGKRSVLVPAGRLLPPDRKQPLKIEAYSWSPEGKKLLVFTNTKQVWRDNTRGDYWVLNTESWQLKKLGRDMEEAMLMFAKFSPGGDRVGYVYKNNIYVEDLTTGKITRLTDDGTGTIINGTSDWVYEEELGVRDGFRWSPDGKWIAYWQFDTAALGQFHIINNTDTLYPTFLTFPYPKVGTANSSTRLGVVSAVGGEPVWMKVEGDPADYYIATMDWAKNSREIVFQRLNRLQNRNRVFLGNAQTGETRLILEDKDEAWVEVMENLHWLDGGKAFTWLSERDGWRHVYRAAREGGQMKLISAVEFDLINIVHLDEKSGWLYFIASPRDAAQRYLYRIPLKGSTQAKRLTPANQPGTHQYNISPNGKWAFHSHTAFGKPVKVDLIQLPGHQAVRTLVSNDEPHKKLAILKQTPVEFFRVDIGNNVILDGWLMKPYNFDPAKKYPLLFYIYGEPAGQTVLDTWGRSTYLWHLLLTQRGYLVASIDPRGTPAPRGRQWRKSIYKQVGILASQDHAAAAKKIIEEWTFVDPARVGIWGWSGGGTMTLNQVLRYPEIYKTAVSIASVPDQRLYDTIYQERYMALPTVNPDGFQKGSPINFVENLQGNLLIIHGTGDDNVHYQGFERLINELIRHNKMFSMMSYPNRSHGISEGENTQRHLFETISRFIQFHMPTKEGS